ncbi:hypothetical protein J7L48_11745 [bacterium]|nr:hypothetical protein [bacterium]
MVEDYNIPDYVNTALSGSATDFIVKAKRKNSLGGFFASLIFSIVWLGISGTMLFIILAPLLSGRNVPITVNGVHKIGNLHNLGPVIVPVVMLSVFVLIGLLILFAGLASAFRKGDYFAGSKDFLYIINSKGLRKIDWEQFSGDIQLKGNGENGTIILGMRTGRMNRSSNSNRSYYVPNKIQMVGIPNSFSIQDLLTRRIKENDPTPRR